MQTQFNVFAKVFFTSSATLSHHLLVLVACKLESFLYELHIKSTPLVMHEKLLKEADTALNVFPVYGQDPKVVCFSELLHVSCLTLLALTDTK